jgi:hypothetical protein
MELSLLIVIALAVVVFFLIRRYPTPGSARASRVRTSTSRTTDTRTADNRVRGQTQRQLVRLVGGNRNVAERLVDQVRVRYPNHNEQWCWEKAIYDIQRDRRS